MTKVLLSDRYELGDIIGRGGMADVHAAVDQRLERDVAVKIMRAGSAPPADMEARFEDEARVAARLNHPNVVCVYDTGTTDDGRPFIVMERLPGETLADRMRTRDLSDVAIRAWTDDVLAAMAAAHAAGIVHRDIKPGNILLTDDGHAKIADFGIARESDSLLVDPTTTVSVTGTPKYIAPERMAGHPATAQSDIWGLGVVLREAMDAAGASDDTVTGVVARATAADPDARFATASEMAAAMNNDPDATIVEAALPIDATRTQIVPARAGAPARLMPTRMVALLAAAAVAIIVIVGIGMAAGNGDDPTRAPARPASAVASTTSVATVTTAPATVASVQNGTPVRTVRRGKGKKGGRD